MLAVRLAAQLLMGVVFAREGLAGVIKTAPHRRHTLNHRTCSRATGGGSGSVGRTPLALGREHNAICTRNRCKLVAMMLMAPEDYASNGGVEVLMDESHEK